MNKAKAYVAGLGAALTALLVGMKAGEKVPVELVEAGIAGLLMFSSTYWTSNK